jgi:acetyl esterase/lipase
MKSQTTFKTNKSRLTAVTSPSQGNFDTGISRHFNWKSIRYLVSGLILAVLVPGCFVFRNAFAPLMQSDELEIEENLVYIAGSSNPKHRLDLFIPKNSRRPFPVAIFIHGGFWKNQDKRYYRPFTGLYWNFGFALAQHGFAVAVISYRTYPESRIDDQIGDIRAAVEWVRNHITQYGGDPSGIHLIGHSAGGHLAAMIGAEFPAGVRSVVALSPILDMVHMKENKPDDFNREVVYPVFGDRDEELRKRSPVSVWTESSVPMAIIVGSKDYGFVFEQARLFEMKAKTENWQVTRTVLQGYKHTDLVLKVNANNSPVITAAIEFFRKHNQ